MEYGISNIQSLEDVERLIRDGVEEGPTLDYKSDLGSNKDIAKDISAFAIINSEPYDLLMNQVHGEWGSAVDLVDIDVQVVPFPIASCAHLQGSHRFDGPKTSLIAH